MEELHDIMTILFVAAGYLCLWYEILFLKEKNSFTTWILWLVLDIVMFMAIKDQDDDLTLICVFLVGTAIMCILLFIKKAFYWTWVETMTLILFIISCAVYFSTDDPEVSMWATGVALFIASIPMFMYFKGLKAVTVFKKVTAGLFLLGMISSLTATILRDEVIALQLVSTTVWIVSEVILFTRSKNAVVAA